jgi:DNA-binding NarL/FixJ family response regulator
LIRVVIVDDEGLVRTGLSMILGSAPDIEVVGSTSGADAAGLIATSTPDVVLLDIRMPDVDGLSVLRELRSMPQPPAVAMLTTFDADEYILTALRLGASGFLLKDTEPERLAEYVRALAAGAVVLSPIASDAVMNTHPGLKAEIDQDAARIQRLSERERQVLVLVAEGLSNADIGARLYVSGATVKDHVSAILTKLEVTSRVQAALAAQRAGILAGPGREDGTR